MFRTTDTNKGHAVRKYGGGRSNQAYFGEDASSYTTARTPSTKRSRRAFTTPKRQKVDSVRLASACIRCLTIHEEVSLDAGFPFHSD